MRLKIQLVLSITALVAVIAGVLSVVYVGQLLKTAVEQSYSSNRMVANQLRYALQGALERGLQDVKVAPDDAERLDELVTQAVRRDAALNAMIESVLRYSQTVNDVAITDARSVVKLSSVPEWQDKPLAVRPAYQSLLEAGDVQRMRIVFGAPAVFEVEAPIERNGQPFLTVRVGVRTTLMRAVYAPWITSALTLTGFALMAALVTAFFLGNFALRPLEQIAAQLDEVLPESEERDDGLVSLGLNAGKADLSARVSRKIEQVGQRVRTAEELYASLQGNLDRILGNLEDGLLLFSRDGRALLVSPAAQRLLHCEGSALVGLKAAEIFNVDEEPGRTIVAALAEHQPLRQVEVRTADSRRLELTVQFVEDLRQRLGALVTLHDPETVEQIGSDLELSRRMAAIGRLTSGVGHEVKNPINAIVVHLELLKNKLADPESPAQRHLGIIESEIHRLDRVVQLLVDFSRPVEMHLADHDLRGIVEAVLDLSREDLLARGVQLRQSLPEQPVPVHADADLLRQAILNVVRNGAQAMEQGGELTVVLEQEHGLAQLRIRDQGPGIAPENLEKIFNLYFTTKAEGSGIGLAMTYRILQLHHGSIDVQSEAGQGAEFRLQLPLAGKPGEGREA